jgi:protein dithiol:quinone oxidoreductase
MKKNHFILLFSIATFLSVASLYFQFIEHLKPCPLCIAQRVSVFALVLIYFFGCFIQKKRTLIVNIWMQLFFALFGAGMAARQAWLIALPASERTGCMPDISLLWNYLPIWDIFKVFLNGTDDCFENPWTFLGINMPEWTLGFFVLFIFIAIWGLVRALRRG